MFFRINREEVLNETLLMKMINRFQLNQQPLLQKYKNYYDGEQKILQKQYTDNTKPINHIITNYCDNIVKNYQGYLTGRAISYISREDITPIMKVLNYNDYQQEDSQYLEDALIYGVAYELQWIDGEGNERFSLVSPDMAFPIYDNSLESDLLYFVRYYMVSEFDETLQYNVEVYSSSEIATYRMNGQGGALQFIEKKPHYYGQVPVSVFNLNRDNKSVFHKILSLQDAYNSLSSSEVDDYEAFVDAYLVLMGVDADKEDLQAMKENRVILLPPSDANAAYLTKNFSDTQIENILQNINDNIHKISASPDFNDENFMAQSGIAMRYKLISFENNASNIASNMKKALQKRIELIAAILNIKNEETVWRDVDIVFSRNLPEDIDEKMNLVTSLQNIVSNKTLLGQLSFISDPDKEIQLLNEQKEKAMELYDFGADSE